MTLLPPDFADWYLWLAIGSFLVAAFVKGAIGFALPMIAVSALASVMPPQTAVALVLVPAFFTNILQATADGLTALKDSFRTHRIMIIVAVIVTGLSAPLLGILHPAALLLFLGGSVAVFATMQLFGLRPPMRVMRSRPAAWVAGGISGFFGGLSAMGGPPVVLYLTARETPKDESVRVQGLTFGCIVTMGLAVQGSNGVLHADLVPLAVFLVVPAIVGIWLGRLVRKQLNQEMFRKITLVVLIVAALNLIRRGVLGL